jgi:hypothetical protein
MTEGVPECYECGFQPYCGADPVRHYRTQGDIVGYKPLSDFCNKNKGVITYLLNLLEKPEISSILKSWAN